MFWRQAGQGRGGPLHAETRLRDRTTPNFPIFHPPANCVRKRAGYCLKKGQPGPGLCRRCGVEIRLKGFRLAEMMGSIPDYDSAVDFLCRLQKVGIKFGLNRTENLLERLGNPHRRFRAIHIAGTNGKGSTAAMLSSILTSHGHRVGLYTSPHLVRFTERFRINDQEAPADAIFQAFQDVMGVIAGNEWPTFFEAVTAMAFHYFAKEAVDWAVVETGMGGRLDATNVVNPEVAIITNVAMDHQEFLGATLSAIAREKAGIVKEATPLVTAVRQPAAQSTLKTTCLKKRAPLFRYGIHFRSRRNGLQRFHYHGLSHSWSDLPLGLLGEHQSINAATALAALEILESKGTLRLDPTAVGEGLLRVRWPGRLEILETSPLVVLDGAHNPHGAESLRTALASTSPTVGSIWSWASWPTRISAASSVVFCLWHKQPSSPGPVTAGPPIRKRCGASPPRSSREST